MGMDFNFDARFLRHNNASQATHRESKQAKQFRNRQNDGVSIEMTSL